MSLMDRIGVDVGRKLRLEDAIEWAARNEVRKKRRAEEARLAEENGAYSVGTFGSVRASSAWTSPLSAMARVTLATLPERAVLSWAYSGVALSMAGSFLATICTR